jgi:hypothetical protein
MARINNAIITYILSKKSMDLKNSPKQKTPATIRRNVNIYKWCLQIGDAVDDTGNNNS